MSQRLSIIQGDTGKLSVHVANADDSPVNLASYPECVFTLKRSKQDLDEAAVFQGSFDSGDVVIDGASTDGNLLVTIPSDNTKDLRMGKPYYWDVQLKDSLDEIFTPCSGVLYADTEATKSS